jgi:hypothetical protein
MTFNTAACFDAFKMNPIPPKGPDSLDDDEGDEDEDPNHVKPKFDNDPTGKDDDTKLDCPKISETLERIKFCSE